MIGPRFVAGGCLCLLLAGCGTHANATKAPTPTAPKPTATASVVVQTVAPTATITATPAPSTTPTAGSTAVIQTLVPNNQEPVVVSARVTPQTMGPGAAIHVSVVTKGPVSRVEVYLGTVGPNAPAPVSYELTQTSGGRWSTNGTVPSVPGTYSYTVGLFDPSGKRSVVSAGGWIIQVGTSSSAGTAQPLPSDVPLAPPFSYGNPIATPFNAEGKKIYGSEVVSNQRTDVSPTAVAQFYESRLPRNGWSVDPSTVPPAGVSAWAIAASKGSRVLLVQFTHSSVQIFYSSSP